jgi:hypothetical protein
MIPIVKTKPIVSRENYDRRKGKALLYREARLTIAHEKNSVSPHRYVIQKRMKIAGAWWLEPNAEAMLALRVNRANNDWDLYWKSKVA